MSTNTWTTYLDQPKPSVPPPTNNQFFSLLNKVAHNKQGENVAVQKFVHFFFVCVKMVHINKEYICTSVRCGVILTIILNQFVVFNCT